MRLRELAQARPRYGYRRVHVLLRRDGWPVNMKRVRRLYRLEGLQLRYRIRRRKHASQHRGIPPAATQAHERWSMDFVHDALVDGRAFRVLTVVDQWSRWSPILEVAQSMSGRAVAEALDQAIERHGKPRSITVDDVLTVESSPGTDTKAPDERRMYAARCHLPQTMRRPMVFHDEEIPAHHR